MERTRRGFTIEAGFLPGTTGTRTSVELISSGPHDVVPELASRGLKRGDSGALHPTGKSYEESV